MTEFFGEITAGVLKIVTAIIGIVISVVIVPWLKTHGIPWLKEKRLYALCTKFVQAAEKLAETGVIDKQTKKNYVIDLLICKGINVTDEIDAFIESAVEELDLAFDSGFLTIVDAFEPMEHDDDGKDEYMEEDDIDADVNG